MSLETFSPSDKPKEAPETVTPSEAPAVSRAARFNMSQPLPPEEETPPAPQPIVPPPPPASAPPETPPAPAPVEFPPASEATQPPSATNPETPEVSRANREAAPGRDDGLSQTPPPATDDPAAAGRNRIQATLAPAADAATPPALQPADDTALPPASPSAPSDQALQPPASPSAPSDQTTLPASDAVLQPQPADDLPQPFAPPIIQPADDTALPPTFKTDYSSTDLGGAANQINAENADINKANRELRAAKSEAARIEAETGLPVDEYRRQAAFRLEHPEMFDSSDPQEILNSSVPVSPSLPVSDAAPRPQPAHDSPQPPAVQPTDDAALPPVSPSLPNTSFPVQDLPAGWHDLGLVNVPVDQLPAPEGVNGPQDFNHHISWADAQAATTLLPQIQQEVAAGKTADDFSAEDSAAGLDWQHGKRRVFDLFFSTKDPVRLDYLDGQYHIISGRHRTFMAQTLGLQTIPAWVIAKKSG